MLAQKKIQPSNWKLRMVQRCFSNYSRYLMVSCRIQKDLSYLLNLTNYRDSSNMCKSCLMRERDHSYGLHLNTRFRKHLGYLHFRQHYCIQMSTLMLKRGIEAQQESAMPQLVVVVVLMILPVLDMLLSIPPAFQLELTSKQKEELTELLAFNQSAGTITSRL